ncbi:AAA family ATPase [Chloroflexota bacterium]
MIPVRLKLCNFMPYRDNVPLLSFAGIHTACISGDNGNGKSALIDAITWALWGKTRAKSDDDLVHQGETETEVKFDFAVAGQPYRIIRKHSLPKSRGRSGQSSLDLFISSDGDFKVISGDSINKTQQKIIDVLHMDYLTFTNSAFLRQGHADEFTQQPPVKRKEVLANILGLSFYDGLEEQAKDLAQQQEIEKIQLDNAIKDIGDELARKPTYEVDFDQAQRELSRIVAVIKEQESRLNQLRREKESLENKRLQLTQLESHITATRRELARRDEELQQHRTRLEEYQELIAQQSTIEEGYAQLIRAKKLNNELDQKFRLTTTLNERKHQLEMAITQAQQKLLSEHALVQREIEETAATSQKLLQLKDERQQLQLQLDRLAELGERLRGKRQDSQELRTRVHHLEANRMQLEQEKKGIAEKLNLLLNQSGAKCPLCESEIGRDGLQLIETKYAADRQSKADSLQLKLTELARQRTALGSVENEVSQLETKLNQDRPILQGKVSVLSQSISEAEKAAIKLSEARKELAEIEEREAGKDFAAAEQKALHQLEDELAQLDYDAQQHEQMRGRLTDLEQYEGLKQRLGEVGRLINQETEALARAGEAAQELQQKLEIDNKKGQDLSRELDLLPQFTTDLTQAETEHQELTGQQKHAQEIMWSARNKLERCSELEIRKEEKEKTSAQAAKQEKIYRDLAQAFGKKGIQALLIEMALPEIETEANRLLGQMTDNRMHVKIETQRPTKKGDVVETLDINISDELGTRTYEMFSGGEVFRINFAIRIALSKLLAKRAGAPMPTMVIDEGFGTQDSVGIEKLKEAINSIQEDFDKILIITHLDELKDAFPTRIDVIKTADGSTLAVS